MGVDFFEQEKQKIFPVQAPVRPQGLTGRIMTWGLASSPKSASYLLLFISIIAFAGMGARLMVGVAKKAELKKEERAKIERSL